MEFRIADTFTDSLARLTGEEQKATKTAAFDLQLNPAHPSLQFHRLDKAKDPNFWSIRVSRDLRIIVHRTGISLLLCYVNHHDEAYQWAERRRLETHPKTGAAQLVEVRERVQEIAVPKYVETVQPKPKERVFHNISEGTLLSYGVPPEWVSEVLDASEDGLLEIAGHLPAEAAEALLNLATGIRPPLPVTVAPGGNPFEHPGRDAPLLRDEECRRTCSGARLPLGTLGGVPASRATKAGAEGFQWPRKGLRHGRHRKDNCCASQGRTPGSRQSASACPIDDILGTVGKCAPDEVAFAYKQRAAPRGAS